MKGSSGEKPMAIDSRMNSTGLSRQLAARQRRRSGQCFSQPASALTHHNVRRRRELRQPHGTGKTFCPRPEPEKRVRSTLVCERAPDGAGSGVAQDRPAPGLRCRPRLSDSSAKMPGNIRSTWFGWCFWWNCGYWQ